MAVLDPPQPPGGESIPVAVGSLYSAVAEVLLSPSGEGRDRLAKASARLGELGFSQDKLQKLYRVQCSEFSVDREPSVA